jgi:nucleoid DNA-binding protein
MAEKKATKAKSGKPLTKNALYQELASKSDLTKVQIGKVFDALFDLIKSQLSKSPKMFTLPGLVKLQVKKKKATKERQGRNPSTGAPMTIPAKPASTVVRARVLKNLTELIK